MSLYDDASLIMYPSGYKSGKIYCQKPTDGSGDLTFTRASTATRVNESGLIEAVASGVPRIDFTGGGCGKLLLEPQRTNTIAKSVLDGTYFTQGDVTVNVDNATSPDGLTKAAKIVPNTSNVRHTIYRTSQAITGGYYSVFVKAAGYDWILLTSHASSAPSARGAYFNVANGTVGTEGNDIVGKIEDYGDGWYRCSINAGSSPSSLFTVLVTNADNTESFAGNDTDGVLVWGCQNEQGAYPTSYIPTSGTAVTRVADNSNTSGLSSVIGQTEGGIFWDFILPDWESTGTATYFRLQETSSNYIDIFFNFNTNEVNFRIKDTTGGASTVADFTPTKGTRYKALLNYADGSCNFYLNGSLVATTTTSFNDTVTYDNVIFYSEYIHLNGFELFTSKLDNALSIEQTTL
jgi:hypothetical protein